MDWEAEVPRLARLARLALDEEGARRLAMDCQRIAESFGTLAAYADALPPADEPRPAPARGDAVAPAAAEVVEAILAAAPRREGRAVLAPRGPG